jgi:hypothetical protein
MIDENGVATQADVNEYVKKHEEWVRTGGDGFTIPCEFVGVKFNDIWFGETLLTGSIFTRCELLHCCFAGADLGNASFAGSLIVDCDFSSAKLTAADFSNAKVHGSDFSGARLRYASCLGTEFEWCNFREADFTNAHLSTAKFERYCSFSSTTTGYWPVCPSTGSFTAYKKAYSEWGESLIVTLLIPAGARRSSATTRKCRADKAVVLDIRGLRTNEQHKIAVSHFDHKFEYKLGEVVSVPNFNPDRWEECAEGIHFFITREEAEIYG